MVGPQGESNPSRAGAPSSNSGAVATRFDKLAVRYEATVHVASINT
ncbi:hypothetical protein [Rhodococcus daqingensis]|uniref:Uncharacterized protein n=1 Tax=Rhodococcus daqingensis TaxID=2479363 RepID=A0ABW2RRQ5_9NOCA